MTADLAALADVTITEPGVYDDIPDDVYHADPVPDGSLSCSGAKRLLPPSCPAIFWYERLHGRPAKPAFDFGHAAHAAVLGKGAPVVIVQKTAKDGTKSDAENYLTKSAQQHRDEAYAAGHTPILAHEAQQVGEMAQALLQHETAAALLAPDSGAAEQSLFWRDPRRGVMLRSRLDWLPRTVNDRVVIPDFKTAVSAEPWTFARAAATYGYHMQHAFYVDGARALGLAGDVQFVFIVQEKTPPYLVSVVELDAASVEAGRRRNDAAIDVYVQCRETGEWPGYHDDDDIPLISLPAWALSQETA